VTTSTETFRLSHQGYVRLRAAVAHDRGGYAV